MSRMATYRDDSLEALKARSTAVRSQTGDIDEVEGANTYELPGADMPAKN
jgi:hypothetical protein